MSTTLRSSGEPDEPLVRRLDGDDHDDFVVDFGATHAELEIDVVDDTAIVVTPDEDQFEFDLPGSDASTFMKNGILTIEVHE